MDARSHHRRQIAEPQRRTRDTLVFLIGFVSVWRITLLGRLVWIIELGSERLVVIGKTCGEDRKPPADIDPRRITIFVGRWIIWKASLLIDTDALTERLIGCRRHIIIDGPDEAVGMIVIR